MEQYIPLDEKAETKRKLASIQIIKELTPFQKNKEIASVLGWKVVVPSGKYKEGEKIIYIEIDSLLPSHKSWAKSWKKYDFRVKTKKYGDIISQGEIFPLSILREFFEKKKKVFNEFKFEEGENLTKILNIVKYEDDADFIQNLNTPECFSNITVFPDDLIVRTDEPRIQSASKYFDIFKGKPYYVSIKYDGTSGTYLIHNDEFYVCSRNKRLNKYDMNEFYWKAAIKYDIYNKLLRSGKKYAIQCELYGPKIGKNLLSVGSICLVIFTIKDIFKNKYLDMNELIETCRELDLPMVKIIEKGDSFNYNLEQIRELAKGNYEGTENPREGIVFRLQNNWFSDKQHRFSFKYVNDDYLLLKNE